MSKINIENNLLHEKIVDLTNQCGNLQNNIDLITNEKIKLQELNEELNQHIEGLKRERVEILKETVEMTKPSNVEESSESIPSEPPQDEKSVGDKNVSRTKSVKQLTKEILKLKNTIKEREAEIADSQMKILSLEEQQQKQSELLQSISSYEHKVKTLTDENHQLKEEIEVLSRNQESEQQLLQYKQANECLQQDIHKIHQEYSATLSGRDSRINELESLLLEYEKQICSYGNTIQQKTKEMTEYINQITKLNDVSQKLKSTIELLEEEKAKDQNAELVKSLNKQIGAFPEKACRV
ncbi:vimentin-like [Manduca sexta]|uniref:vimentin-like n=1 Tax=Manduca sexta TaxID=7130 RepID=UPI00188F7220|nr:vimentin-like [Manduca sexta]